MVFLPWALSVLFTLPKSFEKDVVYKPAGKEKNTKEEVGYLCYIREGNQKVMFTTLQKGLNIIADISILAVIVISYAITWWLYLKARKENQRVQDANKLNADQLEVLNKHVKHIRTSLSTAIGLISICFVVLRLPLAIFIRTVPKGENGISFISPGLGTCVLFYQMQFCVNFIIYAVFMADYRKAFVDAFRLTCPCLFKRSRNRNEVEDIEMEN